MTLNSPQPQLAIGSVIGDYKILASAAEGPRATIYKAEHSRFLRLAAFKVVHKAASSEAVKKRLRRRLGGISQVRHPNLAELYDFGFLEDDCPYLVMEWIDGSLLDAEDSDLPSRSLEERFVFLKSIASAIDEVHLSGFYLGGLDASHVLVDSKRGHAKVIAYSLDAAMRSDEGGGDSSADSKKATDAGKQEDFCGLARLVRRLILSTTSTVENEVSENVEILVARCLGGESEAFTSANSIALALKTVLKLEAPKQNQIEVGTLVGTSYKITGVIGKGGMGQVYEAVHTRLPQRLAIKVIEGSFTEESYIRFRQEAEIAASLVHPHLVRVYDFNTFEDGRPYMVMELLEGEDLGKVMRRGALSPKRTIDIARQVGSALTAVHKTGVVHRDLKPPNVFLGQVAVGGVMQEHATVLDFGISKKEDATISVTKTSAVVGTPQYMAPEQAVGDNDRLTAKTDQFSLGCLIYEMLSGSPAFGRGTLAEVVYRVCQVDPPPLQVVLPSLPLSISNAVERAMSKHAEDRFDSVADFVAALSKEKDLESVLTPAVLDASSSGETGSGDSSDVRTVVNKRGASADLSTASTQPSGKDEQSIADLPTAEHEGTEARDVTPTLQVDAAPAQPPILALAIGGSVFIGVVIAAYLLIRGGGGEAPPAKQPGLAAMASDAQNAATVVISVTTDASPEEAEPLVPPPVVVDASIVSEAGAATKVTSDARRSKQHRVRDTKAKEQGLDPKVEATLDEAEKLVAARRYGEARSLVSRDKKAAATSRGRALAVKTFCGQNNYGAAQDWLSRVPRSRRRAVIAYCKNKHQIELN